MRLTLRDKDYNLGLWAFANEGSHANGNQTSKISGTAEKRPSAAAFFARRIRFQLLLLSFAGMPGWFALYFFGGLFLMTAGFVLTRSLWVVPAVMAASRIVGALTADRLYYRHMRAFIERNQDVNYSKPVIFYLLPVRRLVAASVLSGGLFELYWLYKTGKPSAKTPKTTKSVRPFTAGCWDRFLSGHCLKLSESTSNAAKPKAKGLCRRPSAIRHVSGCRSHVPRRLPFSFCRRRERLPSGAFISAPGRPD